MKNSIVKSILFTLSVMSSVTYSTEKINPNEEPIGKPVEQHEPIVEEKPINSEYFEPGRTIFLDTTNVPNWANNGHHPYMYLFHNSNGSKEWIKMEKDKDNCFKGTIPDTRGGEKKIKNIMD